MHEVIDKNKDNNITKDELHTFFKDVIKIKLNLNELNLAVQWFDVD
jgi:hypothetical protein